MPKVSIVVPIYNVEKYLTECIHSVLRQSLRDFQLILIDDGSPDRCPVLCDNFASEDNRIQVIHKKNGGLSSARNAAYPYIKGKFVLFLDGDDYLDEKALETLVKIQEQNNADVVVGNYWYLYNDHEDIADQQCADSHLTGYNALKELVSGHIQNFAWGKLVRAELVKKHIFPEGKNFEDHFWTHYIFAEAGIVEITSRPFVHYRQRDDSISYTFTLSRLDILDGWLFRDKYLKEYHPELEECFLRAVAEEYVGLVWLVLTRLKKNRKEAVAKLRNFCSETKLQHYAEEETVKKIDAFNKSTFLFIIIFVVCRMQRRFL